MITGNMKISDVVKTYPKAVEIFNDFHIDYCCGGHGNLGEAVEELGIDTKSFIGLLNRKLIEETPSSEERGQALEVERLMKMDVSELIDYIVDTYHTKERLLISEVDEMLNKILVVHYEHHQEQLILLHGLFSDLRKEFQQHFAKEEKLIFPYMKEKSSGNGNREYVKELEDEHVAAGNIIKQIEVCTNDFTAPKDGCATYHLAFQKLHELVKDIYMHIFTENSLLFQK
ncbi:MAG: DUF542 domain-containing protein [Muricomes sp.]